MLNNWWHRHPGWRMFLHGHVDVLWRYPFWSSSPGIEALRVQSAREKMVQVMFDEAMARLDADHA